MNENSGEMAMQYIRIESVKKTYTKPKSDEVVMALDGVDAEIHSGEFVSIVGPSGCGKSTLLRVIAGLDSIDEGMVAVQGRNVDGPDPDRGLLFQDYALFPWKTVVETVEFGLKVRGVDKNERSKISRAFIELVHLTGFEKKYPHELSGGMKQRCALARLLANNPKILLMDEPLAAIDAQTRKILQEEVLDIWEKEKQAGREKTIIWVTHSIEEAVFLSDRVLVMSRRPARIKESVPVSLARPRTDSTEADPAFVELCARLWASMKEEAAMAIMESGE